MSLPRTSLSAGSRTVTCRMMSSHRSALFLALACLFAHSASASRGLTQVPNFQSSGLDIVNSADPSATQTTPATIPSPPPPVTTPTPVLPTALATVPTPAASTGQQPARQPLPIVQAPTPAAGASQPPMPQAPTPTQVLPVVKTPAPAPSNPLPLPTTVAPVPAPSIATPPAPLTPAPAPAKVNPFLPAPVPVPAPQVALPALVPAPVPAPAPGPNPIPQCGVRPTCRLFIEDMLCCEYAGALTSKQHATLRLQCTHPVNYSPQCFNVTGPSNITAFNQFETTSWSQTHIAQVNFLEEYMGNVTVDIQGPRTNQNRAADCGLYVTPCMYEGETVTSVAPVLGMSFSTISTEDFMDISESISEDINNLDSLVMSNLYYPSACQQQNIGDLNAEFFSQEWVSYTGGFTNQCNYTAYLEAMAPATSATGSVQTASLG